MARGLMFPLEANNLALANRRAVEDNCLRSAELITARVVAKLSLTAPADPYAQNLPPPQGH